MGSKSSRSIEHINEPLSEKLIEELSQETGFTDEEIFDLHTNFYRDCPDGKLTLKQFEQTYTKMLGKPSHKTLKFIRHMFNVYDEDHNQHIDFREYIITLSAASVVNRLRLVETIFRMFDLDHDGQITKNELAHMLRTLADVTDPRKKRSYHSNKDARISRENTIQRRIDEAFNELNSNDDDHITKEEFIQWYLKSGFLSENPSNDFVLPNPSKVQEIERKARRQFEPTKNRVYLSHMKENRVETHSDSDEENPTIPANIQNTSLDNDRWEHLFNSVLIQIRESRKQEENRPNSRQPTRHKTWREAGEETLKNEYLRRNSNEQIVEKTRLTDSFRSDVPEILTVRF